MKEKRNYIDSTDFTNRVYAYVCKLNPVKFYNDIYKYHSTEITPIPVKDKTWEKSCEVYFEFKEKQLIRSKEQREKNKAKLAKPTKQNDYNERIDELSNWRCQVLDMDVVGYRVEPQIPDDIALDLMKICTRLANKYTFYLYTCKEDMISNALFKCCRYIGNFSACCNGNALNYFTQIASKNFLKTIQKEKDGWAFNKRQFERYIMDNRLQELDLNTFD